jgi:inorganic pyrophosphatase
VNGYVPGILAPDGDDLDAYFLGTNEPLTKVEGICIAIVHRRNDDDDKLIVVPEGIRYTDEEIMKQVAFQEHLYDSDSCEIVITTANKPPHRPTSSEFKSLDYGQKISEKCD